MKSIGTRLPNAWKIRLTFAVACVATGMACGSSTSSSGSSSPTAPGSGTGTSSVCRTYPTAANVTITTLGITQNAVLTGAFNTSTNQGTITVQFTNGSPCSTAVHGYRSTADFVDEVRVIPPAPLEISTTTSSGSCGSGTGTVTLTYDSTRRLTQVTAPTGTTTYTAWDTSGRATTGSFPGGSITNVYNDAARTVTQTQTSGGVTTVSAMTYDANGGQTMIVNTTSSVVATTTFNNTSTATVCK